jgi:hypothetical protein
MNKKYLSLLPIRIVLFILSFSLISLLTKKHLSEISNLWSIVVSLCNILTIIILLYVCKKEKINYFDMIKYKKGYSKIYIIIIVSILTLIIGFSGMYLAGYICYKIFPYMPVMMLQPITIMISIINIFFLPITTTMAEDGLYLGIGVNQIKNKYIAILFPALFYALQHSFIPFLLDTRFIIYRFISFFPLTIIFCIYYYRKRNPLPIMVGHFIINIATVFQIFIMSMSPALYESIKNV